MSSAPRLLVVTCLFLAATGCGDDDECGATNVPLAISVDGRNPSECASWELQVRACSTSGSCDGGCGPCVDGEPDPECEPVDACASALLELPPGDYRICLRAELPNGGISFDGCSDASVASAEPEPVALSVETQGAFPCIRDWEFNGTLCCNDVVGACVPPGS